MRKTHAFLLSGLVTLVLANSVYLFGATKSSPQSESVVVDRVIDGDTLDTQDGRRLRLANINTPEKGKPGYETARAFLQRYKNHSLRAVFEGTDNRGTRLVAQLYTANNEYLNLRMVQEGLASKAWVAPAQKKEFAAAETQAIQQGKGLWKPSPHASCITLSVAPKTEEVSVRNTCTNLSFSGWWIKDESREIYTITNIGTASFTLYTGKGTNTATILYWNKKTDVWNNDRDTAYLFDNENRLLLTISMGINLLLMPSAAALEITFDAPPIVSLKAPFKVSIHIDSEEEHDVKIYVQDVLNKTILSQIQYGEWKNPFYYLKATFPTQREYTVQVIRPASSAEICVRFRSSATQKASPPYCQPISIQPYFTSSSEEIVEQDKVIMLHAPPSQTIYTSQYRQQIWIASIFTCLCIVILILIVLKKI